MSAKDDLPVLPFPTPADWAAWLEANHACARGLWVKLAKKGSGIQTISYEDARDLALCYGWIDGQARRFDDAYYLQRFTPRRARSPWSKINRARALELIATGEMKPAGLAEVERAQADGRWDAAYDAPSTATVPDDLRRALDESPRGAELFARLDAQNRYAILHRLQEAKRPETRARRLEQFVGMLAEDKTLYPLGRRS